MKIQNLAAGLTLILAACGVQSRDCPVALDQKASFMAAASSLPLQVRGDLRWSSEERNALAKAVARWNLAARNARDSDVFSLNFAPPPVLSSHSRLDACELPENSSAGFSVYRATTGSQWNALGFANNTPAVTIRCHQGEQLTKQAILVNPSLIHSEQLMSVFLHELGHSIGLDHSCQLDRDSETFRGCAGLKRDHPYVKAVMFPTLKMPSPSSSPIFSVQSEIFEVKEFLQTNDLERANCVLQP